MHGIAARAGLNKQLIAYYFGGKEGLYREVVAQWLQRDEQLAAGGVPLDELAVRYLEDALKDPRLMRLALWRGLTDDKAVEAAAGRRPAERMSARKASGELAEDLDPRAVLLVLIGAVVAPVALPHQVRSITGVDVKSREFASFYSKQLRRVVAHLLKEPT